MAPTKPDPYSLRKNTLSKMDIAKMSKWAAQPDKQDARIDRSQLWVALNQFVSERGGKIVSPMHAFPIRLETDPESELAQKLEGLGYTVTFKCTESRIGPPMSKRRGRWSVDTNNGYTFYAAKIYEVDLPNRSDTAPGKTGIAVQ